MVVCSVLLIAIRIRAEIRTNEAKLLLLKLPANTFDQKVNFISEAFEKKVFCIPEIMKAIGEFFVFLNALINSLSRYIPQYSKSSRISSIQKNH